MTVAATCENQQKADQRLPILLSLPIRHREVVCEPMLEGIDLTAHLQTGKLECVIAGGESGPEARLCRYEWITDLARQCEKVGVPFTFKQTGAHFEKDGRVYNIPRGQQHEQAKRAGISTKRKIYEEEEPL